MHNEYGSRARHDEILCLQGTILELGSQRSSCTQVLDSLFLCFDKSAEQFGCTKIETVFETYLAGAIHASLLFKVYLGSCSSVA